MFGTLRSSCVGVDTDRHVEFFAITGPSDKTISTDAIRTCWGLTLKAEAVARRVAATAIFMVAVVGSTHFKILTQS